jgi:nicotinate phosphoribosyltransferase
MSDLHRAAGGLCTDLYEIRMAASYLRRGMTAPATFSLFVRRLPPTRGFLVAAGLESCLGLLTGFGFDSEDLAFLRRECGFTAIDTEALAGVRFTGDVRAVPEGTIVFADEPLLEVTAPLPEAQLVETLLLNQITFATTIASKAARCRLAAPDATLVDFAARRTHGLEAALTVARSSALAGFDATSYVQAARELGLTAVGTMAHSYVQAFPSELEAFSAFAEDFPAQTVFLVDTYDTTDGISHAIEVARTVGLPPGRLGLRLDSGDLATQAHRARRMLDAAGLGEARIMASGGLDEYAVADLVASRAPIDLYGIGTRMGVSWDAPSLDSAYKLVAYDGRPVMKLSAGKVTAPGAKQVYRSWEEQVDLLCLDTEPAPPRPFEPLLETVMTGGRRTAAARDLKSARQHFAGELRRLPASARALNEPESRRVTWSPGLRALTRRLTDEYRPTTGPPERPPSPSSAAHNHAGGSE